MGEEAINVYMHILRFYTTQGNGYLLQISVSYLLLMRLLAIFDFLKQAQYVVRTLDKQYLQ